MTLEQAAALMARAVCAQAEIEGMRAENTYREQCGLGIAYDEEAFLAVPARHGIDPGTVRGLNGVREALP